jgi:hypothetical protein
MKFHSSYVLLFALGLLVALPAQAEEHDGAMAALNDARLEGQLWSAFALNRHLSVFDISVDVEASGPSPSTGSLLSIGACLVAILLVALFAPGVVAQEEVSKPAVYAPNEWLLRDTLSGGPATNAFRYGRAAHLTA